MEWVETSTPTEGRVLFEESGDETGFVHDGTYLSSFIPQRADRQLIGGPHQCPGMTGIISPNFTPAGYSREIQTVSDRKSKTIFVSTILAQWWLFIPHRFSACSRFRGLVGLDRQIGAHSPHENQSVIDMVSQGSGKAQRRASIVVELSELKGKEIVLKYHWTKGLSASPPASIVPVKIGDDLFPSSKLSSRPPR